jgi:hypothetical protein
MNNNKPTATDGLNYALLLIHHLPDALIAHVAALSAIQQRLDELQGRTCTGRAHWRDKNASGKTAKLYILHGTDQVCPVHGKPLRGGRTRSYIGNKPDKISDAIAAIERETERQQLHQDLRRLENAVDYVTWRIKELYRRLNHDLPEPGQDPPTRKPASPEMVTK